MRKKLAVLATAGILLVPVQAANAGTKVEDLRTVDGLSDEQKAAIDSYMNTVAVEAAGNEREAAVTAAGSRRASYYRGSFLMWTRDNVDFGYNFKRVTWTSAYQQSGSVFPNIARNKGIKKYHDTAKNDRFRAKNTIGAGIVTPWGDVKVYESDFIHRLSVRHNGAWRAWSD